MGGVAVAIGEPPARLLDDQAHRGDVVGGDADGVDGKIERTFGDQTVLPEVAESARLAGPVGGS